ncbi:pseudouridine synthase [Neomicrococcus aestuarii]|uniref:RNA pseudouridylate synthase n=1 Tax=Neomicrococcus aestuarii TaxID=556325 RepID=A0A1L2ZRQ7_9MICC|nr:pseudouridine synthase [Neomicrococcus aestuarii]APF41779.1 pseudouridine synthase [Neomicrococcus aestuarii]
MKSPLPVRNGVNATRLRLPRAGEGPWLTVMDYVLFRFGHVDPDGIVQRFEDGEVVALDGSAFTPHTPLGLHEFLWYYRDLPTEPRLPVEESIIFQDEHLVAVDKPHFLPTTPGGRYVQESALVRLRNRLNNPDLIPMHRLDRATAGVVLFSTNPDSRGAYQVLFEKRRIKKTYQAVSVIPEDRLEWTMGTFPSVFKNRMAKEKGYLLSRVTEGAANARTRISVRAVGQSQDSRYGTAVLWDLDPLTGKTHQLRVHLAALGCCILHDPFYPVLLDEAPDDYSRPLQLLASSISFVDPFTKQERRFESGLALAAAPISEARG